MMNTWNPAEIMERLNHLESIVKALPVTPVEANPEGEASTDLTKLTVGETIYAIPEATPVEANPEGEASTDLTKLTVGETIYAIPEAAGLDYGATETKIGKYKGADLYTAEVTFSGSFTNGSDNTLMSDNNKNFVGYASDISVLKETVLNKFVNIDSICGVTGVNAFYIYISSDKHTIGYHPSIANGGYGITAFSIYVLYTKNS